MCLCLKLARWGREYIPISVLNLSSGTGAKAEFTRDAAEREMQPSEEMPPSERCRRARWSSDDQSSEVTLKTPRVSVNDWPCACLEVEFETRGVRSSDDCSMTEREPQAGEERNRMLCADLLPAATIRLL